MEDKILKRSEVPVELTWNLEGIFASEEEYLKEMGRLESMAEILSEKMTTFLSDATSFLEVLDLLEEASIASERAMGYAAKQRDIDTGDALGQRNFARSQSYMVKFHESTSYILPMVVRMEEEKLTSFYAEKPELEKYRKLIEEIRRTKDHSLSPEMEKLLAGAGHLAMLPFHVFSTLSNADMKFPEVRDKEGKSYPLTNGRYIGYMEAKDRDFRKEVFTTFYETFARFKNTIASLYSGQVNQLMFFAKNRNYPSILEAALDENNVSPRVYENLIEAIHDNMDKMHRYVKLRKKMLGLSEIRMYDVFVPMVDEVERKYSIEEAKELVLASLAPLGEEYCNIVKEAFRDRWLDVMENEGKRSGAYSSGLYGDHPYILLNFNGTLSNVFTLAHEIGHAMHSYYSNQAQTFFDSKYTIFVAEVASTTNEVLLTNYLLEHSKTAKEKALILNHYIDSFKSTVYRQTMFAEFEKKASEMAESGVPLQADNLSKLYLDLNKAYFGQEMKVDELIKNEWLRIPHFYFDFYVYQYATGFSAAVSIATRILKEGETALAPYLAFLKSGCTKDPVSLLKIAGVDMSTKQPINEALSVFDKAMDELEVFFQNNLI